MPAAVPHEPPRRMRADARRNRERIVAAAIELFVEHGVEVPLDAIARHAEVGIGTLYRRFPDRDALIGAVALQAFSSVRELADSIVGDPTRDRLLERFVLGVAQLRVGVLMTSLLPTIVERAPNADLDAALDELLASVGVLVAAARSEGQLRDDVAVDDLLLLVAMLTRPLAGLPLDFSESATPRLLLLALDGLRPRSDPATLPPLPPRLDVDDLQGIVG